MQRTLAAVRRQIKEKLSGGPRAGRIEIQPATGWGAVRAKTVRARQSVVSEIGVDDCPRPFVTVKVYVPAALSTMFRSISVEAIDTI